VFCFSFLIKGNFQGFYYDVIKPHTQKQTLAKSIEKLSEIDIVLSEQLMNPIKAGNFSGTSFTSGERPNSGSKASAQY